MLLKEIISIIHKHYPPQLAYEWDNSGLILGDPDRNINKLLLSLDVTPATLEEAIEARADCIISHHPFLFSGIQSITANSFHGKIILKAAEHKIALFAAHTNMDTAPQGINQKLSKLFGLKNSVAIEGNTQIEDAGLGQIGTVEPTTLLALCQKTKELLHVPHLRFSGEPNQIIHKIAIGSGSCSELIPNAIQLGADVMITGDLKYHTCLEFASKDFSIIDAGHFPTEQIAIDMFYQLLRDCDIEIVKSKQTDIFHFI